MRHTTHNRKLVQGFTLVEMVVYVAIVALVLFVIVNMVLVIAQSNKEFRVSRNIQNAAITSMESMTRTIQDASVVSTVNSTLGSHPGDLYLDVEKSDGTEVVVEYELINGRIHLIEDGVDLGPVTPSNVEITNLVFYVGSTGLSQMVRIEMTIQSDIGTTSRAETFYATSIVRGSY